jgi:hypothetical protein
MVGTLSLGTRSRITVAEGHLRLLKVHEFGIAQVNGVHESLILKSRLYGYGLPSLISLDALSSCDLGTISVIRPLVGR